MGLMRQNHLRDDVAMRAQIRFRVETVRQAGHISAGGQIHPSDIGLQVLNCDDAIRTLPCPAQSGINANVQTEQPAGTISDA